MKESRGPFIESVGLPVNEISWSSCKPGKKVLVLKTALRTSVKNSGDALLQVSSIDGKFAENYGILWRRCQNSGQNYLTTCQASVADLDQRKYQVISHGRGKTQEKARREPRQELNSA